MCFKGAGGEIKGPMVEIPTNTNTNIILNIYLIKGIKSIYMYDRT